MQQSIKKILKIFMYLAALFILLTGSFFLYFYLKKDVIAAELLMGLNENINGEVRFTDIYLDPFAQFPSISMALEDFSLYENEEEERTILEDPVAEFEDVFIAIDVFDLFSDRIEITKVLFTSGYLDIIKYGNSRYNFELALERKKAKTKKMAIAEKTLKEERDTVKTKRRKRKRRDFISKNLRLNLNRISFRNVHLEHNNQLDGAQHNFFIYSMISSLSIMPDSIRTNLFVKTEIKNLQTFKNTEFDGLIVQLNSKLNYSRNDSVLLVETGKLMFSRAEFRLKGMLELKEKGKIDLKIRGADKKLGFLNLLLSKSGLENIKQGSFFFNGRIKGSFKDEIPEMTVDFGIKDLFLRIPGENDSIKSLEMTGSFFSGNRQDLSGAILKIDSLKAVLPGGALDGSLKVKNFATPGVEYKLSFEANVRGFDRLIRQQFVDSLDGFVSLKSEFNGEIEPELKLLKVKKSKLDLTLDSVSFIPPHISRVVLLSGFLSGDYNKLQLKDLKLNSRKTDLKVNGNISGLSNLIVDKGTRIRARFKIRSDLLNTSDFLSNDSSGYNNSNYQIRNLDLRFNSSLKKADLIGFKYFPKVSIGISKLKGSIDSLLKPIRIDKGQLYLSDHNEGYLISLEKCLIKAGKGNIVTSFTYRKENEEKSRLDFDAGLKQIKLIDIADNVLIDSILPVASAFWGGQIKCNFIITKDQFRRFKLVFDKASYTSEKNTIKLKNVKLSSNGFYFNAGKLDDLNGTFNLEIGEIKSKYYAFNEVVYSITAKNKNFTIVPENDSVLGVKAEGKLIVAPYDEPPSYSLDYSLKQFSVGKMFVNFLEDSVLSGKADFYMNLNFKGHDEKSILETLDGRIRMRAKGLTLYGANLDKFIDSYRKSQSLNLLDIGVTIYAGPIGLLATKGGGFARVKVTDRKKKSSIDRMLSDWKIIGDSLVVDDVALRTKQNRLALKGWYNYSSDSLDFKIGLLDEKGCSVLKQGFRGSSIKPEMDNIGIFDLHPKRKEEKACEVFYKGKLEHVKNK